MTSPLVVKLYARSGCHLCEQAEADLGRLRGRYPHQVRVMDIDADVDLRARYDERIPVLVIGEREYAAPLWPESIERALAAAMDAAASAADAAASPPRTGSTRGDAG
jgi:hypothetical protein